MERKITLLSLDDSCRKMIMKVTRIKAMETTLRVRLQNNKSKALGSVLGRRCRISSIGAWGNRKRRKRGDLSLYLNE